MNRRKRLTKKNKKQKRGKVIQKRRIRGKGREGESEGGEKIGRDVML